MTMRVNLGIFDRLKMREPTNEYCLLGIFLYPYFVCWSYILICPKDYSRDKDFRVLCRYLIYSTIKDYSRDKEFRVL